MDGLKSKISRIIQAEKLRGDGIYGPFRSPHEGYAVIREEIEEVEVEMERINSLLYELWQNVKIDESALYKAELMYDTAVNMAAEAVQVAAMALKYIEMESRNE